MLIKFFYYILLKFKTFIQYKNLSKEDFIFAIAYDGEKALKKNNLKKSLILYNIVINKSKSLDNIAFLDMYYSSRAKIYFNLKQYNAALEDINMAINLKPQTYIYYFERSQIKEKLNDITGVQEDIDKISLILKENNSEHIFKVFLAEEKIKKGLYKEASLILSNTDEIKYDNEKINSLKLKLYNYLGDNENLLKVNEKLIKLFPKRIAYYENKYQIYIQMSRINEAKLVVDAVLSFEPDNELWQKRKISLKENLV